MTETAQLKQDIQRLFISHDIIKSISEKESFEEIALEVLGNIEKKMNYSGASISVVDIENNTIQLKYVSRTFLSRISKKLFLKEEAFRVLTLKSANPSLTSLAAIENRIIIDPDIKKFIVPPVKENVAELIQKISFTKNMVAIPIRARETVIGVLNFTINRVRSEISEHELKTLELLVDQVGLIIDNAQKYEEIQSFNIKLKEKVDKATEDLVHQNEQLRSIFNITNSVVSTLDPKEVTRRAVDMIASNKDYIGGILALLHKNRYLKVSAYTHTRATDAAVKILDKKIEEYSTDLKEPGHAHVMGVKSFKNDEVEVSDSVVDALSPVVDEKILKAVNKLLKVGCLVTMPVKISGENAGTLTYFIKGKKSEELTDEDMNFMKTIAQVIGVALQNARSFEQKEDALNKLNKATNQLEEKYEELKNVRARERDMLDIMGHELRTPLSIIRITLGAIKMKAKKSPENFNWKVYEQYDKRLNDAIRQEVELLETMLTSTKIDANRMEFHMEEVDVREIIKNIIIPHREKAAEKDLQLKVETSGDDLKAYSDAARLGEVIDNLLSNAVKYTYKGYVLVKAWSDDEYIKVAITDTGLGIPKVALSRLGEKFFRVKQYIGENDKFGIVRPGGTGLGLYVTFGLIKMMQGKVEVESELEKGSTFTVTIPKYTGQEESIQGNGGKDLFKRLGLKEEEG